MNSRRIAIAVDLSKESAYAVKWAVKNYLREGDDVMLLHVRPTSNPYGADWGSHSRSIAPQPENKASEDKLKAMKEKKPNSIAEPLIAAGVHFEVKIVSDHDMKERICLELERLDFNAVIMGSRGIGGENKLDCNGRLGSVSDYCVHHCVCPVVVVRFVEDEEGFGTINVVFSNMDDKKVVED
ncbi:Adenine nucleotide alpha hydrolases-like superfamily [Zostera marina]|uniref:Adenine nucleotide alpha hydrolases-like superfamily n=1 Tax=Zostera marina TaxID=29655 RepID=A0A0K9PIF8_ZOSMR|nr:Adenine nucleotide alpha hydrolases-like superfamily [Zostera marina]